MARKDKMEENKEGNWDKRNKRWGIRREVRKGEGRGWGRREGGTAVKIETKRGRNKESDEGKD